MENMYEYMIHMIFLFLILKEILLNRLQNEKGYDKDAQFTKVIRLSLHQLEVYWNYILVILMDQTLHKLLIN